MTPESPFTAPWQAEAFAMAVALIEAGHIDRTSWAEALRQARAAHPPDDGADTYWADWLTALEQLAPLPARPE